MFWILFSRLLRSRTRSIDLELERLGLLPGVRRVTEVAVRGGLQVLGLLEVELSHDNSGSEVPVVSDDVDQVGVRLLTGTVSLDKDGQGLGDTDGVRQLDQASSGKTGVDQRLGDPSRSVGGRSVNLGEVLTREGTTTVGTPTSVGVDNDLSAGQTSVTLRTTDNESAGRLNVVDGSVVQEVGRDDLVDDLLLDLLSEVLGGDLLGVLGGDDDGVDSQGDHGTGLVLLVLDGDLGLGVRSEPAHGTVSSGSGHGGVQLVGKHDGLGHQLGGLRRKRLGSEIRRKLGETYFVGGITEHDTLVTCTVVLQVTVVQTLGDIGRLLLNSNQDVTGLVVETLLRVVVTDLFDGVSDNGLEVDSGLGGDFTEDHDHTGLGGGLTGDLGVGVLGQTSVEDGIRDLVTDLVCKSVSG